MGGIFLHKHHQQEKRKGRKRAALAPKRGSPLIGLGRPPNRMPTRYPTRNPAAVRAKLLSKPIAYIPLFPQHDRHILNRKQQNCDRKQPAQLRDQGGPQQDEKVADVQRIAHISVRTLCDQPADTAAARAALLADDSYAPDPNCLSHKKKNRARQPGKEVRTLFEGARGEQDKPDEGGVTAMPEEKTTERSDASS